jgi:hypothetical protein
MNILIIDKYEERGKGNLLAFKASQASVFFIDEGQVRYKLNGDTIQKCEDPDIFPDRFACILLHSSDRDTIWKNSNTQSDNIVYYTADIDSAPINSDEIWIRRSIPDGKDTLLPEDSLDIINWCKDKSQVPRLFSSGFPYLTSLEILCQAYLYLHADRDSKDDDVIKAMSKMKIIGSPLPSKSSDIVQPSWWLSIFVDSDNNMLEESAQEIIDTAQIKLEYEWHLKYRHQNFKFASLKNLLESIKNNEVDSIIVAKAYLSISK